ncbi:UDP-glucose 4-epimerase family protein [Methylotenera versatilis]|uniref:NAD-dependent epimerase/dehydratase n=1 Tax=Methylotenera versatilis (strain 301) TaxID=666681 RepID=D7DHV2_METV0|nr:SDR family oxidoreductase [Methylotenera versatilis]ADI29637.1 NAD-dependent epimerase/dehydratase [Methylotenera versatilis 301]
MKILVTGANGFVGSALCAELLRQKHVVVAVVRKENTELGISIQTTAVCSIDNNTDWSAALRNVDVVVHLAARVHVMSDHAADPLAEFRKVNVEGPLNLARQASKASVKRFIFMSSIKVNGEHTAFDLPFTEESAVNPQDPYGTSKFEAEQGLMLIARQTGMEIVVIRPPLVYGAGVKANFASMMRMVKRSIPLPLGAIHNKRSFVYIDNLVSLIMKCINHPAAANQVFLVSDGNDLSTTELLRGCASALGVRSRLLPIPQKLIEFLAALIGKKDVAQRLCGNLQVDITKARRLLDWKPPITVEEGLKATAIDFNKV